MARPMPRRSLIEGSVSPAAISVTVPTSFPGLAQQATDWGNISNRASQFSNMLAEIAGKQAKAKGAAYGARTAPTVDQLVAMKNLGQPVILQGDPGSQNIYEQNVYAAQLAVTEDRYELLGRKTINELIAQGADPNGPYATPDEFQNALEVVVTEYSGVMSAISPSSGAKVGHSLGLLANSAVLSFSRTYMEKQIDADAADALASVSMFLDNVTTIVDGHQSSTAGSLPTEKMAKLIGEGKYAEWLRADAAGTVPSLDERLDAERTRMITHLTGRISGTQLKSAITSYDKKIAEAKISRIARWAAGSDFNAREQLTKPFTALSQNNLEGVQPDIKEIWESLDDTQQAAALDEVTKIQSAIHTRLNIESDAVKSAHETQLDTDLIALGELTNSREFDPASEAIVSLIESIKGNPEVTPKILKDIRLIVEKGETVAVSEAGLKSKLSTLAALNSLTPAMIFKAQADSRLTGDDAAELHGNLRSQRDRLVKHALDSAYARFTPDLKTPRSQLQGERLLQTNQYLAFTEKLLSDRRTWEKKVAEAISRGDPVPEGFFDPTSDLEARLDAAGSLQRDKRISDLWHDLEKRGKALLGIGDHGLEEFTFSPELKTDADTIKSLRRRLTEISKIKNLEPLYLNAVKKVLMTLKELEGLEWPKLR